MNILLGSPVRISWTGVSVEAGLTFNERLRLSMNSGEFRNMRGNLIEIYKILTGINRVTTSSCWEIWNYSPRISDWEFRIEMKRTIFSQRVANLWHNLPNSWTTAVYITAVCSKHIKDIVEYGKKSGKLIPRSQTNAGMILHNNGANLKSQMFYICCQI